MLIGANNNRTSAMQARPHQSLPPRQRRPRLHRRCRQARPVRVQLFASAMRAALFSLCRACIRMGCCSFDQVTRQRPLKLPALHRVYHMSEALPFLTALVACGFLTGSPKPSTPPSQLASPSPKPALSPSPSSTPSQSPGDFACRCYGKEFARK